MAGAGYKTFADGDVLTAAQVQTYLQDQAVMRFADSSARTTALGASVAEGMVSYLQDTDKVEVYDGSAWVGLSGGFTASTAITATDASWSVPTLDDPVVRVTVIGAGGGGGSSNGPNPPGNGASGSAGTGSTFACSAGTATAGGGFAGIGARINSNAPDAQYANTSANGGVGATIRTYEDTGGSGGGGEITVAYLDMTGVTTANVTIGAGGAGGTISGAYAGGDGFNGVVIFEYRAG